MNMQDHRIKITFGEHGSAPELEVTAPICSSAVCRIWAVLACSRVTPLSAHLIRNDGRLIARVKLSDADGAPLGQHRAVAVMSALKECLADAPPSQPVVFPRLARGGAIVRPWPGPGSHEDQHRWSA